MFECKKILNGRGNVPEPEVHTVGSSAITAGMALNLSGGVLVKATGAPTHIALADAAANTKVACYAVLPGMIKTDRWQNNYNDCRNALSNYTPLGDIAEFSDIADAVWYFAAHARNTTGAELVVDGGNMIQLYPIVPEGK